MEEKRLRVALTGNPNCGKTTLFNSLTGATAYVGNWPGVTVEKRTGVYHFKGKKKEAGVEIVDLPGIYSLSPFGPEEVISRDYVLHEKPDLIINVIDATNLERNLYMTTQILELDIPVVLALNMTDILQNSGETIDAKALEKALGIPVVLVSALKQTGLEELMKVAVAKCGKSRKGRTILSSEIYAKAEEIYKKADISSPLFHAIRALEKDELEQKEYPELFEKANALNQDESKDVEAEIASERYAYLAPLVESISKKSKKETLSFSDKVDRILTHRVLGFVILVAAFFFVFHFTFTADLFYLGKMGVPFGNGYEGYIVLTVGGEEFRPFAGLFWNEGGINSIGEFFHVLAGDNESGILGCICLGFKQLLLNWNAPAWVVGFFYDGVLNGVASVLGFVPQIMILFAFFSLMEDSGYMARVAFMLDRIFRRFGVSGKAFIPMIMGFGCAVPAIVNTRVLGSEKEKTKTIRVIPFFTCGAKAEFLAIIAAAVAAAAHIDAGLFTFAMYFLGVIVAIVAVIAMNKTTQREKVPPFIMEFPAYHRPQLKALGIHVWDKGKHFIQKAFTIILVSTIVVWFFANFNWSWAMVEENGQGSILMSLGSFIQPLFTPMGWGVQAGEHGWAFTVASIQGVIAKENVTAVVETLSGVIGVEGFEGIVQITGISTGAVVAFAVFNMLTIPCFASIAAARGEFLQKKQYWLTIAFWLGVSYVLGCLTFITIDYVWTLAITLPVLGLAGVGLYFYDRLKVKKEQALA